MEINIGFNDVQDLPHFKAQLCDTWLDFMLVHTFAMNVTLNKSGYLLLTSQASSCLKNNVKSRGGVTRWGKKNLNNHTNFCNTVIAPYFA
jgi:hypothetical protein